MSYNGNRGQINSGVAQTISPFNVGSTYPIPNLSINTSCVFTLAVTASYFNTNASATRSLYTVQVWWFNGVAPGVKGLYADIYPYGGGTIPNQFAILSVNNQGALSGMTFSLTCRNPTPPPGAPTGVEVSYFINCFGYPK